MDASKPVRVTLKMAKDIPDLRNKKTLPVIKAAIEEGNGQAGFKVIHHVVEKDRLLLIVEAKDTASLSRGMKGFNVRFARNLNRVFERTGSVLADRYGSEVLRSPRDVKQALRSR